MAKLKKAQFGRLFNKAGAKMVQSAAKKTIRKATPAAMSPVQRDITAAITRIERGELKKKLQAIERKMQGEDILKSIGKKKQRNGGKIKPKASNVSKKLGSYKKTIGVTSSIKAKKKK